MQDTVFVKIIVLMKTTLKYKQKELLNKWNNIADIRCAYRTLGMLFLKKKNSGYLEAWDAAQTNAFW
jgi:hypothetical protein